MKKENTSSAKQLALIIGAIGVVYGDIGTSPLYAFNEIFYGHSGEHLNPENVIGSLSLIFWALTLIISIKYLVFVIKSRHPWYERFFCARPVKIRICAAHILCFHSGQICAAPICQVT